MKKYLVFSMLFVTFAVKAESYDNIVKVLKYVETGNQPNLVGDNGDSYGVLQIQWAAVQDVNRYFGTNYTHDMMFQPECAEEVTKLYMQMGAELYEKRTGKKATEEVLVKNHNGGIYQGYRIKATNKYYRKYLKWKSILIKSKSNVSNNRQNRETKVKERESPWSIQIDHCEFSTYQLGSR